ncbi:t26-9p [Thermococcus sp. Bubb.Bath]|uniref:t26-9p n=1 Tax=Thermococcus sp. Bubb.Bath TaxID=1638242 RepID=UPI001439CB75|nr:t26-9p [Thermococcus sp. Bubb.Bath]NJF24545.1 t26-9p [Thermococcus sp. Bubb.Bath]
MDVNSVISQFQSIAQAHPYLALAVILFLLSMFSKNKLLDYLLWFLAAIALLKAFGLSDTFFSFLKSVPSTVKEMISMFGGA